MLSNDDMIFYKNEDDSLCSGGDTVDTLFKKLDMPAIYGNMPMAGGGTPFTDLAVPAGLFVLQQLSMPCTNNTSCEDKPMSQDLYNRLINMVQPKKISKTRKKRSKKQKRFTRKK